MKTSRTSVLGGFVGTQKKLQEIEKFVNWFKLVIGN